MKKMILLLLPFLLIACHTPEEKVKRMIRESFQKDYGKDYQEVSWGSLDSLINTFDEEDKWYNDAKKSMNEYAEIVGDLELQYEKVKKGRDSELIKEYHNRLMMAREHYNFAKQHVDHYEMDYEGFKGWTIEHAYLLPNKWGDFELHERKFFVDKDFKNVYFALK